MLVPASILSGAHMTLVPKAVALLGEQDAGEVFVTVGGTVPAEDIAELEAPGVAAVATEVRRTLHVDVASTDLADTATAGMLIHELDARLGSVDRHGLAR